MPAYPLPSKPQNRRRPCGVAELRQAGRVIAAQARSELGDYLDRWPWQMFGTVTTRRPMSVERAERVVWPLFEREVRCRAGHSWQWFRATEPFEYRPGVHLHFLGLDLGDIRRDDLREWCFHNIGRAEFQPFDPALGATHYLCKYVVKGNDCDYRIRFSPQADKFRRPVRGASVALAGGLTGEREYGTRAALSGWF